MNYLYLINLKISDDCINHPIAPIVFNTQHDLRYLKKTDPILYIKLLSYLFSTLNPYSNENLVFFIANRSGLCANFSLKKGYTADEIVEILENVNNHELILDAKEILGSKEMLEITEHLEADGMLDAKAIRAVYRITEPKEISKNEFQLIQKLIPSPYENSLFDLIISDWIKMEREAQSNQINQFFDPNSPIGC